MKYNHDIHHRRSVRLKNYDYSQAGAYFVTICTQNKECLFGTITDGTMTLNEAGKMVQAVWDELPVNYPDTEIDQFIVMPNHVHGIVVIVGAPLVGAPSNEQRSPENRAGTRPAPTLGDIVGAFKSISTHEYTHGINKYQWPSFPGKLWQRNYYEHIIRNEDELNKIRNYISQNPAQWVEDEENIVR